ncbi:MAG: alpha-galactosidase [Muribaculaceae bacterium]|nr:alpha-galactosidase [Muribaculaceae bacterium]
MAIQVEQNGRLFNLHTKDSTYQMYADEYGVLLHTYYGKKIDGDNMAELIYHADVGFSGNPPEAAGNRDYSLDCLPQELPSDGVGDYRESCVSLSHGDGSMAADFRFDGYEVIPSSYKVEGMPSLYDSADEQGETLVITMREKASRVTVHLFYGVFEKENIITRAGRVESGEEHGVTLTKCLSCCLDFQFGEYDLITFAGRHMLERNPERNRVRRTKLEIGSMRGTSSHQYNPVMILCAAETTEDFGDCYGLCLVYSSNFTACAQKDQRGQTRVLMGINPDKFSFDLRQGESFDAPQVILSYSDAGFTKLSHQYHKILREHMCRGKYQHAERPVLLNNWEATYFDFNEEKLISLGKQAADLGIEMLVLDDGWFGKRDDDNSGLGDWFVNEGKLGSSLRELGEKIHDMGMKFGLWFEPEMVSEDSDLYRTHPDWALRIPGREPNRSRNQLVLDMGRSSVREYLFERIADILKYAPVDYVKWDVNRSLCDIYSHQYAGKRNGEVYHRYILGVYDLLERILEKFPHILLESCSGGGGRFDAAMLYYSPQIWCSDNTDAVNRLDIQYGTSFFYPVSSIGSHVSAVPNHQTGRVTPFQTRGHVALSGSFGYELDLGRISEAEKEMVRGQIDAFHKYYSLTHEGTYYRLTQPGAHFCAWEFVDEEKEHALQVLVMTSAEGNPLPVHTAVKGLSPDRQYHCSANNRTHSGRTWMNAGLTLHAVPGEYESVLIEWNAVEGEDSHGINQ